MSESEFLGQRKDEKVLGVFRKSQYQTRRGYYVLVAALAIGLVPLLIFSNPWKMVWWFSITVVVAGLVYLGYQYVLWYYTVFVLTNERLRVIQQNGFFRRRTTDLELHGVASVSVDTPNVLGVVFKYGTLHIQSNVGEMTIFNMKNPERVCADIQNAVVEAGGRKPAKLKSDKKEDSEPRGEIIFEDDERIII
ncbi:PH domain-containing protein [Candidatus Saccharibacteria bacterium]|nr:PH domain-containing protein [Candidatus Saccharibacteria bacterium]